ncbi:hypothetical protein [Secundilactobacillus muriivasis]
MKKSVMFKMAHIAARSIVAEVGDYQIAFSICLKKVWKIIAHGHEQKLNNREIEAQLERGLRAMQIHEGQSTKHFTFGIPNWIISKHFNGIDDAYAAVSIFNGTYEIEVVHETEKARLINFMTTQGQYEMWCPKSVMVA